MLQPVEGRSNGELNLGSSATPNDAGGVTTERQLPRRTKDNECTATPRRDRLERLVKDLALAAATRHHLGPVGMTLRDELSRTRPSQRLLRSGRPTVPAAVHHRSGSEGTPRPDCASAAAGLLCWDRVVDDDAELRWVGVALITGYQEVLETRGLDR